MNGGSFRYQSASACLWLRGNTHVHTTRSDGGKSPEEVADMYAAAGYDFICLTDHWVASEDGLSGSPGQPLVILDGIEIDGDDDRGSYFHVVCIGTFQGLRPDLGLVGAIESARAQGGLLVLAHPFWTGNTVEEALRYPFHAVETYNHLCSLHNGKGSGLYHWDAVLEQRPGVHGLAVDDAHINPEHPGWNGGWIMVAAGARSPGAVMEALRDGRYYSTCGPEIHEIEHRAGAIWCRTSPVCFAWLIGPRHRGTRRGRFGGATMTEFELEIPEDYAYLRLEVSDELGRRAWTNTLFHVDTPGPS